MSNELSPTASVGKTAGVPGTVPENGEKKASATVATPPLLPSEPRPDGSCNLPAKGGAPRGNFNRGRHGMKARFPLGVLPAGFGRIERNTSKFRAGLEEQVMLIHGEIDLVNAAVICTAVRWERHAQMAMRWLRIGCSAVEEKERLTPDQKLSYSRDIARASAERDKCLRSLGLNVVIMRDLWDVLDATAAASSVEDDQADPEADPVSTIASGGQPGVHAGNEQRAN